MPVLPLMQPPPVLSAFAVSSLFLTMLMIMGQGLMVAGAGFSMVMMLIIIPSMLSGTSFWLISAYKNQGMERSFKIERDHGLQLATVGARIIAESLVNPAVDYRNCSDDDDLPMEERL